MSKLRKKACDLISKAALANAKKEANSACVLFGYQPKISKETKKKLRENL